MQKSHKKQNKTKQTKQRIVCWETPNNANEKLFKNKKIELDVYVILLAAIGNRVQTLCHAKLFDISKRSNNDDESTT
jgi:hypothetical protein